jgi:chromate transporter
VTGVAPTDNTSRAIREVFPAFLKLGLTSFGGPVAHLGYFRSEFVAKRRWVDEAAYADILALCQFLPGPASSQVGLSLGLLRAGIPGAFCAWLGFTTPSALLMIAFGYGVGALRDVAGSQWLHGLKIVAVAVVAQAVIAMARTLAPDPVRAAVALAAGGLVVQAPTTFGQIVAILFGALVGWWACPPEARGTSALAIAMRRRWSAGALALFVVLLAGLPIAALASGDHLLAVIDSFYRSGALVFGGGHVVLPLLQAAVVPQGWVSNDDFLSGYGAAQALPGPLFTFAAYLGTVMNVPPNGWQGGIICLLAIFLPSFLLVLGGLPLWSRIRDVASVQAALMGVNAAVVGLLAAALYNPVWTSAIFTPLDFALALAAFALLWFRTPPWLVVILGALAASVLNQAGSG